MTAAGWIALSITVFGSFCYAAASILQAVGARRSTSTVKTMGHPLYLVGTACDLLAWAGSMIALRELAVYLVESVLAGSLAITVVAARVILKSRLRGLDVMAVVVSIAALTALGMSAGPQQAVVATSQIRLWLCVAAPVMALLGFAAAKARKPGIAAGLAGLSLGGAALVGRVLPMPPDPMHNMGASALAVVTEPLTAALLVLAVTGMLLYANSLQYGQVGPVTAVLWIAEVIAPSAVALLLLGDTVRPGWDMIAAVSGLVVVVMAVLLATAPGNQETAAADQPQSALKSAGRHALPAPEIPEWIHPRPAYNAHGLRVIRWGPSPVWVPPARTTAALASHAVRPQLTWRPPPRVQPEPVTRAVRALPAPRAGSATAPREHPWDDL